MDRNSRNRLQTLTIRSDFMFSAVMTSGDNCKDFLEMVLGFPIDRVEIDREKNFLYHPDYHGIRLDIYAKDESNTHYNVEMQVAPELIQKRTRYYHSQMDTALLPSGSNYSMLPDTYVIFICVFDPFGLEKYIYDIKNYIKDEFNFDYDDGNHTIVLSTKGRNKDEVPQSIVNFLDFIEKDSSDNTYISSDAYVKRLQKTVNDIKMSRDMEQKFMLMEELLQKKKEEGYQLGKEEGIQLGKQEGIQLGLNFAQQNLIKVLNTRFSEIPDSLLDQITRTKDIDELNRMFDFALIADSIQAFQTFMEELTVN